MALQAPERSGRLPALDAVAATPVASFVVTAVLFVLLVATCTPVWGTNDDLGMSMRAHGYGSFVEGSPNLIFSNVVWGHLVRVVPRVGPALGYSVATMLVLFAAVWALVFALWRLGAGAVPAALAGLLVVPTAVGTPQFTVTAGILAVAAVATALAHARTGTRWTLVAAAALAYLAWLIRWREALLVFAVAAPAIPWRVLWQSRRAAAAGLVLVAAAGVSFVVDRAAYRGSEWDAHRTFTAARVPYSDYGVALRLRERPDVAARHGFTVNDVELVRSWFFADPELTDARTLDAMRVEVEEQRGPRHALREGLEGITAWRYPRLALLAALALVAAVALRARTFGAVAALAAGAAFALGALGRPGIFRVQFPVAILLVVVAVAVPACRGTMPGRGPRRVVLVAAMAVVAGWGAWSIVAQQLFVQAVVAQMETDARGLPEGTLVTWGGSLPLEWLYPVLDARHAEDLRLHALGSSVFAPLSVAAEQERSGRGIVAGLLGDGILLADLPTTIHHLPLLANYCAEHHGRELATERVYHSVSIVVDRVRCVAPMGG